MTAFFTTVFGASWKTSLLGLIGGMMVYFDQIGVAFPTDAAGWKSAIVAAGIYSWGRLQKDSNVSNAKDPVQAAPVVVP